MSDLFKAVLLGIVEGLTEFLPVSSTGHLILVMPLLGVNERAPPWNTFLFLVQIGAILAVIVYFGRTLIGDLVADAGRPMTQRLAFKIAAAFLPAAVIGLLLDDVMERYLEHPLPIAAALIVGAVAMEWIESRHRAGPIERMEDVSLRHAVWIGLAQCISIVPGTSRSMATIFGGMWAGLRPAVAARFSFYLAIPTLCAAGGYRLLKHWRELRAEHAAVLTVGFVTSFVVALFVVDGFMTYIQRRRLRLFAAYRVGLGLLVIAALLAGWIPGS